MAKVRDAGLYWRIFLKCARLFEVKYVGKYAKLGKICGAHMPHICGIFSRIFPPYATSSDEES